jgi:uncharacterized protein
MFGTVKRVGWPLIIAVVIADIVLTIGVVAAFTYDLFSAISRPTGRLISDTMVANIFLLVIVVGGMMLWWGKLRPRDLGLVREHLPQAVVFTVTLWVLAQAISVLYSLATGTQIALNPSWERGVTVVLGSLIGQLFGNALYEEITFRGFLLPQVYRKFEGWVSSPGARMAGALVASQLVFALIHIPIRLYSGMALAELPASLAWVFVLGLLFAGVYLLTGNLFVAVGVHALTNAPTMLLVGDSSFIVLGSALLLLAVWIIAVRRRIGAGARTTNAVVPR